jgi:hypothetical protein
VDFQSFVLALNAEVAKLDTRDDEKQSQFAIINRFRVEMTRNVAPTYRFYHSNLLSAAPRL